MESIAIKNAKKWVPITDDVYTEDGTFVLTFENGKVTQIKGDSKSHIPKQRIQYYVSMFNMTRVIENGTFAFGMHDEPSKYPGVFNNSDTESGVCIPDMYALSAYTWCGDTFKGGRDREFSTKASRIIFAGANTGLRGHRQRLNEYAATHTDIMDIFIDNYISVYSQLTYKYVMNVEGNTYCWDRLPWIMNSSSLMFWYKPEGETVIEGWYYPLIPEDCYVTVKNLDDLPDLIEYYNTHTDECIATIQRANKFVDENIQQHNHITYIETLFKHIKSPLTVQVMCVLKNNERWVKEFITMSKAMEEMNPDIVFKYNFFENDSVDDTVKLLKSDPRFIVHSEHIEAYSNKDPHSNDRMQTIATVRNTLLDIVRPKISDYVLIVDSDIYFEPQVFTQLLDTLKDKTISMACPYSMDSGFEGHYYDTYAFLDMNGKCYWPKCIFKNCKHSNDGIIEPEGLIDVRSAFGGFSLVRGSEFLNPKLRWGTIDFFNKSLCEHILFCEQLSGRVVINCDANKVVWGTRPNWLFLGPPLDKGAGIGFVIQKYCDLAHGEYCEFGKMPKQQQYKHGFFFLLPPQIEAAITYKQFCATSHIMTVCETETVHESYKDFAQFDKVYLPSEFCVNIMKRQFPSMQCELLRHYTPLPIPKPILNKTVYRFYTIGNIADPRKNINMLLDAFKFLQLPDCHLVLKATCKESVKLNIPGVVVMNSMMTDEQIDTLHNSCDCYINCSNSEGVGMGAVEAAMRDKPVIISEYGGLKEYVKTPYIIPCSPSTVGNNDFLYTPDMKWGKPKMESLIEFMKECYTQRITYMDHSHTKNLNHDVKKFFLN